MPDVFLRVCICDPDSSLVHFDPENNAQAHVTSYTLFLISMHHCILCQSSHAFLSPYLSILSGLCIGHVARIAVIVMSSFLSSVQGTSNLSLPNVTRSWNCTSQTLYKHVIREVSTQHLCRVVILKSLFSTTLSRRFLHLISAIPEM